ncbi:hypothetical protein H8356DRAFT_1692593 [Neocallimastix lanati (nom. inval.)]|uniref:Uncharacterized protein n=1 Tax=Neocallimastix californiae TaxID=1754190 RepID=A0A1Y2ETN1_9FUNG|nr:hypothetical protein H8356DRAFT_1692593 [Neocallimastix sp. JGI-2020a]ORY74664.1 hypothetical protein LY90DRAFT_699202 [Neocallimastix californiae]|eukprot:ORY74664.1 hypothetical protein LY90DRAFT_699202 [Neocallimastix californiae]
MKIFVSCLTVLSILNAFTNALQKSYINNNYQNSIYSDNSLIKRNNIANFKYTAEITNVLQTIGLDANTILTNASDQCLTSIENTYECFDSVNKLLVASNTNPQKFDEICTIYESQTCDYFRNTVVTGNSGCVNDYDRQFFSINFDMSIFYYVSSCTKNEKNEYCPAVNFYRSILSKNTSTVNDTNKVYVMNQSCSDSKCFDQMKKILAVTPSVIKGFDLMYPSSGETDASLNQIKTVLDVTPIQEPMNSCEKKGIVSSYAISVKAMSVVVTSLLIFTTFFIIL